MELARWTAHPARQRPRDLALACAVVFLTAGAVLASFESLLLMTLAVVIVIVSIAPFWLPTRYRITDQVIEAHCGFRRRSRQWQQLRRYELGRHVALLSPFADRHWLDRFRGMLILLDGADRDRIQRIFAEKLPRTNLA